MYQLYDIEISMFGVFFYLKSKKKCKILIFRFLKYPILKKYGFFSIFFL